MRTKVDSALARQLPDTASTTCCRRLKELPLPANWIPWRDRPSHQLEPNRRRHGPGQPATAPPMRILRSHVSGRLRLSDQERSTLAFDVANPAADLNIS